MGRRVSSRLQILAYAQAMFYDHKCPGRLASSCNRPLNYDAYDEISGAKSGQRGDERMSEVGKRGGGANGRSRVWPEATGRVPSPTCGRSARW